MASEVQTGYFLRTWVADNLYRSRGPDQPEMFGCGVGIQVFLKCLPEESSLQELSDKVVQIMKEHSSQLTVSIEEPPKKNERNNLYEISYACHFSCQIEVAKDVRDKVTAAIEDWLGVKGKGMECIHSREVQGKIIEALRPEEEKKAIEGAEREALRQGFQQGNN